MGLHSLVVAVVLPLAQQAHSRDQSAVRAWCPCATLPQAQQEGQALQGQQRQGQAQAQGQG